MLNANASGLGDPERVAAGVGAAADGVPLETRVTTGHDELRDALAAGRGRRTVMVGGDGSLHAALNAGVPLPELGLIPAGRANNVARALGLPVEPVAAARVALGAPARPLDVLRVESAAGSLWALEGVSAGLQAEARHAYDAPNSSDLRAGFAALAGVLARYRPYRAVVTGDRAGTNGAGSVPAADRPVAAGSLLHDGPVAQVFVANLRFFAFGIDVSPAADPRDGLVEVVVVEAATRSAALAALAAAWRGRLAARSGVSVTRVRAASIDAGIPAVADSAPLPPGPVHVAAVQGRLRLACA